jgi:predicted ribonuclease YlaK
MNLSPGKMRRRRPINADWMVKIEPLTENQKRIYDAYEQGKNLFIHGSAGTGKTFVALYLALRETLQEYSQIEHIYVVRSLVATRDIGFLPGDLEEKSEQYMQFYSGQIKRMFSLDSDSAYDMLIGGLQEQGTLKFLTTSFLRGATFDNSIIIVDEFSNCNFHELDSIITRVGEGSKIIFCGDTEQSDLYKKSEYDSIAPFMSILKQMPSFACIEMGLDDIVRSGLVKEYLTTKYHLGLSTKRS